MKQSLMHSAQDFPLSRDGQVVLCITNRENLLFSRKIFISFHSPCPPSFFVASGVFLLPFPPLFAFDFRISSVFLCALCGCRCCFSSCPLCLSGFGCALPRCAGADTGVSTAGAPVSELQSRHDWMATLYATGGDIIAKYRSPLPNYRAWPINPG